MTGKNRIRDETTARCTNDTRAFGFKTEQENPPTCMPAGGGRPTLGHDVWIDIGLREQSK